MKRFIIIAGLALLAGCATGAPGSARRICYDSGIQPGTAEFENCWKGVRDRQFAAEAPAMVIGATAGAIAATPAPTPDPRLSAPTWSRLVSQGGGRCVYSTSLGQRITAPVNGMCPAQYGR